MKFDSSDLKISDTPLLTHKDSDTILKKAKSISKELGITETELYNNHTTMTNYLYVYADINKMVNITVTYDVLYFFDDFFGEDTNSGKTPDFNKIIDIWNGTKTYESNTNTKLDRLYTSIQYISKAIKKDSPVHFFEKYTKSVTDHLLFSLKEIPYKTVEKYISIRLFTGGMFPVIHLIEYAYSTYLNPEIIQNEALLLKELCHHCALIGSLSNDLFSYAKEKHSDYNLINAYLKTGEATNHTDAVSKSINKVNEIYQEFKTTFQKSKKELTNLSKDHQSIVSKYLDSLEVLVSASYHWQKSTNRYKHPENIFEDMKTKKVCI